ncbi:hypothetical protein ANN_05233 [Periplaneta americana]|uniref:Uncharacterized protein n=1 Tax=Periplaneta americana TaxID=6978 RepID=A0ABQ8TAJ2_PERAM|nr:hypothetical protein ANN_05233 [Periplaneta americana]
MRTSQILLIYFLSLFPSHVCVVSLALLLPGPSDRLPARPNIRSDNEIAPADCGHLSNSQTNSPRGGSMLSVGSGPSSNGNSNSMGGPLMGGPVNGQTSGSITSSTGSRVSSSGFGQLGSTSTSDTGNTSTPYTTYTLPSSELNLNDFDFFPTSTWGTWGPAKIV